MPELVVGRRFRSLRRPVRGSFGRIGRDRTLSRQDRESGAQGRPRNPPRGPRGQHDHLPLPDCHPVEDDQGNARNHGKSSKVNLSTVKMSTEDFRLQ